MVSISVIVPVYNSEKYLKQCLDSILNQTFKNFELILVDDGSTDESLKIIENYALRDERISVVKQTNMYAGAARNKGLSVAKGKYVIFLDSDDFFKLRMLEILFKEAEKYNAQIVQCWSYKYDNKTKRIYKYRKIVKKTSLVSADKLGRNIFSICSAVPWDKLILRTFLVDSGLKYLEIQNDEDEYFNRMIVALADRIVLVKKRLIYYRVNNSKSLQGNSNRDLECYAIAMDNLKKELKLRNIYKDDLRKAYISIAVSGLSNNFMLHGSRESRKNLYEYVKGKACPNIIDSIEDISSKDRLYRDIISENYEDFLVDELMYTYENSVSRNSVDYYLGHGLAQILRRIRDGLL
jgi:glycosyltransferase involved in cell wall biosynthesis